MRKLLLTILKSILFFLLWMLIVPVLPDISFENKAIHRLWGELIPLVSIIISTFVCTKLVDRQTTLIVIEKNFRKSFALGGSLGIIWLGSCVGLLFLTKIVSFGQPKYVDDVLIWLLAVLLNTIMQEFLIRGYFYSLLKRSYGFKKSLIITSIVFTALHGGAIEAGVISTLNVFTMSVLMSILLEHTGSLLAPILAHFIWNGVGCILLGVVKLASDYPSMLSPIFTSSNILSGGVNKMEGSIIVLLINFILIVSLIKYYQASRSNMSIKRKT